MDAAAPSRAFAYDGLAIRVSSNRAADLAWLEAFLSPWFEPAGDDFDCRVELIADDAAYRASLDRTAHPPDDEMHAFSLDRGAVRLPGWKWDGALLLHDRRVPCSYVVERSPPRVRVLAAREDLRARFALMRAVRELAMEHARARGHLLVHAACIADGADAYLIAGPKRAGKTSLLLGGLLPAGGSFVSNDRVVVEIDGGRATARGMPTIVSIRRDAIEMDAALRRRFEQGELRHWLTSADEAGALPAPTLRQESIDLSPAQVCALLGVERGAAADVRGVVFPRAAAGSREVRELAPSDAEKRLAESLLGAAADDRAGLFAALLPRTVGPAAAATPADLAACVPSVECPLDERGGTNASRWIEARDRLADVARCASRGAARARSA